MTTTPHRLYRDERGMSLVFVGVGFMAFLAATTLAIDVGMFATARSQAQNSADAGALAGAIALYFDDYDDRSTNGPAKQNAMVAARENQVIGAQVSVTPPDVTFPARAHGPEQPREGPRVPQRRARQPGGHADGPVLRRHRREHPGRGHRGGLAGQRDDLRQALHDSRQVDRASDAALGSGRHVRDARHSRQPAGQSRCLHPGRSAGVHRLQRGARPGRRVDDPRGHGQQHHARASTSPTRLAASAAAASTNGTSPTATPR